ncbi:MAG TPA: tripartite tricarboxylate transporter substrate-binding protein, partial [Burkholderiaceae bacterium]
WGMFFVATGTPDAIVQQLARDIDRIVQQPDIRQRFMDLGVEARSGTAAEAKAEVKDDYEYWGALINELGVLAK